jgi:hypothetical protein
MWQLMQLSATELPTPKRLDVAQRAVRVVSQRVGHLVFAHRHVRHRSFGLRDLQPVARGALEGLRGRDELPSQPACAPRL